MFNIFDNDETADETSVSAVIERAIANSSIVEEDPDAEFIEKEMKRKTEIAKIKASRKQTLIHILRRIKQQKADADFRKLFGF